jgi:hypothetical protein
MGMLGDSARTLTVGYAPPASTRCQSDSSESSASDRGGSSSLLDGCRIYVRPRPSPLNSALLH